MNFSDSATADRRGLPAIIAERFEQDIRDGRFETLPSAEILALRYGVSRRTMLAAASLLRVKGLLRYGPRRPMRIAGMGDDIGSSTGRLFDLVKADIAEGRFRAGEALPKPGHWPALTGIPAKACLEAYHLLVRDRMAYRRGKSWVVGQPTVSLDAKDSQGAIFVVAVSEESWLRLNEPATRKFLDAFLAETLCGGVRLQPVPAGPAAEAHAVAEGFSTAITAARVIGPSYLGACLPAGVSTPGCAQWVAGFSALRRPVVLLDTERTPLPPVPDLSLVYRACFSERPAIKLALKTIIGFHRRHILFLYDQDSPCQVLRRDLLLDCAARTPEKPVVQCVQWRAPGDGIQGAVPSDLAHDIDTKAVFIAADSLAGGVMERFAAARVIPGRDLPVISFDNDPSRSLVPVDSVDPGFGRLGWAALHALLGDVRIQRDREGYMAPRPAISRRGSALSPAVPAAL